MLVIAQAALLAWNLEREHLRTLDIEYSRLADGARITNENISGSLRALDLLLRDVGDASLRYGGDASALMSEYMATRARAFPEVRTVLMTNAAGVVTSTNQPRVMGMDTRDRPYYDQVRNATDHDATFFTPLVQTKPANVYVIFASRALPSHDGQWSGFV
ncbi:MAG: hypothetical protein WCK65_12775 [Rhodospirillaceae bacterium]